MPKLANYPINESTQHDLERCLKSLLDLQHDTAKKAPSRLNVIIKYTAAPGLNVDVGVVDKPAASRT